MPTSLLLQKIVPSPAALADSTILRCRARKPEGFVAVLLRQYGTFERVAVCVSCAVAPLRDLRIR